jgi:hypothetical protein
MKKFLLTLIVLISISTVYAQTSQLLINENFTGYTNGNLNNTSSGQGGAYPWTAVSGFSSDFAQVSNSSPLFYTGYTSGTQYVNLTAKDDYTNSTAPYWHFPDDPSKGFTGNTNITTNVATTFYMSFVVRVPSSAGVSGTTIATPEIALQTTSGSNLAYFYIADANSGSNLKFGISKDGADGIYSSGNYSFNTTYLIVLRYDIVTGGSSNDKMYLWVNPIITSEPSTGSANVSITSGSDGSFTGTINSVQLFQSDNSATASLDALKVAYARNFSNVPANSAAAWNALNPVGTPLPVKFGDIKGYTKGKGVQLEWNVYSEINVVQYEIERASDGVSFNTVGHVTASGQDGELFYSWYDATPSAGNNYYRIRNVDIDGKSSYSSIVRVSLSNQQAGFSIYPNPATGNHISMQATDLQKGDYKIEIFNTAGQQVYRKQFNHAGGTINQSIELPTALQTGIYTIQLTSPGFKLAKQFLVQ